MRPVARWPAKRRKSFPDAHVHELTPTLTYFCHRPLGHRRRLSQRRRERTTRSLHSLALPAEGAVLGDMTRPRPPDGSGSPTLGPWTSAAEGLRPRVTRVSELKEERN